MKRPKKNRRTILFFLLAAMLTALLIPVGINGYVMIKASRYFYTIEDTEALRNLDADCVLVLGAWVRPDGTLSDMLHDRVSFGVKAYEAGAGRKLLMSGDHGKEEYDEVNAMKDFAKENSVNADDVFMDHAGFSTYESMYRAKEVFGAKKVVIVTQKYHLYRAVYIARALGLEAYGIPSNPRSYGGLIGNQAREFLARVKDFGMGIVKPQPTYLGDAIPISGSGAATDDKKEV